MRTSPCFGQSTKKEPVPYSPYFPDPLPLSYSLFQSFFRGLSFSVMNLPVLKPAVMCCFFRFISFMLMIIFFSCFGFGTGALRSPQVPSHAQFFWFAVIAGSLENADFPWKQRTRSICSECEFVVAGTGFEPAASGIPRAKSLKPHHCKAYSLQPLKSTRFAALVTRVDFLLFLAICGTHRKLLCKKCVKIILLHSLQL